MGLLDFFTGNSTSDDENLCCSFSSYRLGGQPTPRWLREAIHDNGDTLAPLCEDCRNGPIWGPDPVDLPDARPPIPWYGNQLMCCAMWEWVEGGKYGASPMQQTGVAHFTGQCEACDLRHPMT